MTTRYITSETSNHRSQAKYWIFTYNNPTEHPEEYAAMLEAEPLIQYYVFQLEQGEETGTQHFQGYVEFTKRVRWNKLRQVMGQIWAQYRRGSQQQAIDYCTKAETRLDGPFSGGTKTISRQGRRTDLEEFKNAIIHLGKREYDLIEDGFVQQMAKYPKLYSKIRTAYFEPSFDPERRVELYIGEAGTGKTRMAFVRGDNFGLGKWVLPKTSGVMWFDTYDGQGTAILDDFCGKASKVGLDFTLTLLDKYRMLMPIKGSFTIWEPKLVIVTTNISPEDWYDYSNRREQRIALKRRFDRIVMFRQDSEPQEVPISYYMA